MKCLQITMTVECTQYWRQAAARIPCERIGGCLDGGAGRVRTAGLRFRKPPLYPAELQPHEREHSKFISNYGSLAQDLRLYLLRPVSWNPNAGDSPLSRVVRAVGLIALPPALLLRQSVQLSEGRALFLGFGRLTCFCVRLGQAEMYFRAAGAYRAGLLQLGYALADFAGFEVAAAEQIMSRSVARSQPHCALRGLQRIGCTMAL